MIRYLGNLRSACLIALFCLSLPLLGQATATPAPGLLNRTEAAAILPDKVFFRGQSATIQGRNSAGIRLADGKLILFTAVDTSGYSSALQQTYQAYILSEVPLHIGDHTLAPGAYGFGYIANDQMVVMDIGGNELFRTPTAHDAEISRPTPLQLLAQPGSADRYRLYLGRTYVVLSPVAK